MTGNPPRIDIAPKGFALVKPSVVDFLRVCAVLPKDEREQYEAFQGRPYEPERVALEFATSMGPAWTLVTAAGEPVIIGGFSWMRPMVWRDWLLSTPQAWSYHWRTVSKVCRRVTDQMMRTEAHRIECVALASRTNAHAWYRLLHYEFEATLTKYGAEGEDAVLYRRVN